LAAVEPVVCPPAAPHNRSIKIHSLFASLTLDIAHECIRRLYVQRPADLQRLQQLRHQHGVLSLQIAASRAYFSSYRGWKGESKPCLSVLSADVREEFSDGLFKRQCCSCFGVSQELFEFGPGVLDGVEVWGVGGQVEDLCADGDDPLANAVDLMRTEVVHDNDIAGLQRGVEHVVQVGQKDLGVGGSLNWRLTQWVRGRCVSKRSGSG
jgi:hypothetical protein